MSNSDLKWNGFIYQHKYKKTYSTHFQKYLSTKTEQ